MQKPPNNGSRTVALLVAAFILLYVFFPYIYILPSIIGNRHTTHPPIRYWPAFRPLGYLVDHAPIYNALLSKEAELVGFR